MIRLAAGVDPGTRHCGIAVVGYHSRQLVRAWLAETPRPKSEGAESFLAMAQQVALELDVFLGKYQEKWDDGVVLEVLTVERMAIRGRPDGKDEKGRGKMQMVTKNPSQIIDVAHVAAMVLIAVKGAQRRMLVWPQSWNGGKKKAIANTNVWRRLSPEEKKCVEDITFAGYDSEGVADFRGRSDNVVDAVGIAKWATLQSRVVDSRVPPPAEQEKGERDEPREAAGPVRAGGPAD